MENKVCDLKLTHSEDGFFSHVQVPEDHGEDDSSEKTPSKASKSPQKATKRPKTVPVKVSLLDGSDYEAAVEVCYSFVKTLTILMFFSKPYALFS